MPKHGGFWNVVVTVREIKLLRMQEKDRYPGAGKDVGVDRLTGRGGATHQCFQVLCTILFYILKMRLEK